MYQMTLLSTPLDWVIPPISVSSNSLGNFSDSSNGFFNSSVFFSGLLQRLLRCLILPLHVCLHECFKLLTYFLEWIKLFVCPFQLFKHRATPIQRYIYSCVFSNGLGYASVNLYNSFKSPVCLLNKMMFPLKSFSYTYTTSNELS